MKVIIILIFTLFVIVTTSFNNDKIKVDTTKNLKERVFLKYNPLNSEEQRVILSKGTEAPYSGKFYKHKEDGTYICRQCNAPLYKSSSKFDSGCGWPSFDDEIQGAVKRVTDADGRRVEIVCATCGGHLGHVFEGEQFTLKNTRHCVNSISIDFQPANNNKIQKAYFAGGCFWGVEYYFEELKGVKSAISGYMGGTMPNPDYRSICTGTTGHLEVVEVTYDSDIVSYEELAKLFFETHDPEQTNGQGPDIGSQYLSAIFYDNDEQKQTAKKLINILEDKGYKIATKLISTLNTPFFEAEDYHQDYYFKHNKQPYCHTYKSKF
ncbi:MAG: bifunctional methionine sulfoxide reductase B/A protein [Campylobacterota bacterium]|nr:bifunctional methionine sulfoxide reductase B/A protein [Campylobacterota bacterium]